jgi:large subunit ribosomal protein L1
LTRIKELAHAKFDESVDIAVNLGIDASKGEQTVRGTVLLPNSFGKAVRVVVFAKGDNVAKATKAGADYVGLDDLAEKISGGWMEFDAVVATPDVMAAVSKVGKILGPRGLMPNPKTGTVTVDVENAVKELKQGRKSFKNDKQGIVHFSFGKVSLEPAKLQENLRVFVEALAKTKPATSKGRYLQRMTLSSTMGVGITINPEDVSRP